MTEYMELSCLKIQYDYELTLKRDYTRKTLTFFGANVILVLPETCFMNITTIC